MTTLTPTQLLDPRALSRLAAIGGPALVRTIVETFLRETPDRMAMLRRAFAEGDLRQVARVAHTLISSLGHVGADPASALAREVERAADAGAYVGLDRYIDRLSDMVAGLSATLAAELPSWAA